MQKKIKAVVAAAALVAGSGVFTAPAATAAVAAQHCVAEDTPVGAAPSTTPVTCYSSFEQAISAATNGRVQLNASQGDGLPSDAEMNAPAETAAVASYVLAVDFRDSRFRAQAAAPTPGDPASTVPRATASTRPPCPPAGTTRSGLSAPTPVASRTCTTTPTSGSQFTKSWVKPATSAR